MGSFAAERQAKSKSGFENFAQAMQYTHKKKIIK